MKTVDCISRLALLAAGLGLIAAGCGDAGVSSSEDTKPESPFASTVPDSTDHETSGAVDVVEDGVAQSDGVVVDKGCVGLPDGAKCDDQNPCTDDDSCSGGFCVGGSSHICESTDPCKMPTCVTGVGCVVEDQPDGTACSLSCLLGAECVAGECTGGTDICASEAPPKNSCISQWVCNLDTGACDKPIYRAPGTACDVDEDSCTFDECNGAGVCQNVSSNTCDKVKEQYPCRKWSCYKGACNPGDPLPGKPCNDGETCTSNDSCLDDGSPNGTCAGEIISAEDGNPCTDDTCDKGLFSHTPLIGKPCEVGPPCESFGTCDATAKCVPIEPCCWTDEMCNTDSNDLCLPERYCDVATHKCVDKPETKVVCDPPAFPCYVSKCVPATGACVTVPAPDGTLCDDGDYCTVFEACTSGSCGGGQPKECGNGSFCDGEESCDPLTSKCFDGTPPVLEDDGIACTYEACSEEIEGTSHTPKDVQCDDGNPCTKDVCDVQVGCTNTAIESACDDGNPCTLGDVCKKGVCTGTSKCDDGKPCTEDLCLPDGGCGHADLAGVCDDGDLCTQDDVCVGGACVSGVQKECAPPASECLSGGACEPLTGLCSYTPEGKGKACDDGDQCTSNDACDGSGNCAGLYKGECSPTITQTCTGLCGTGTKTCTASCSWGVCSAPDSGECVVGMPQTEPCGNCGSRTRTCGSTCSWGPWSTCSGEGPCAVSELASESQTVPCSSCGTQEQIRTRTCGATCAWGLWTAWQDKGACSGQGQCSPNQPETQPCGTCGTQTRTCSASCSWGSWSTCSGQGLCTPNDPESESQTVPCGNCGTQQQTRTRTCGSNCSWGSWGSWQNVGSCSGQGQCTPNLTDSQTCGSCGTQTRTCNSNCTWGTWSGCSAQGTCAADEKDTEYKTVACDKCGSQQQTRTRTCSSSCSWGSWGPWQNSGSCSGQGVCAAGEPDSQSCGQCGKQTRTCSSSCSWNSWSTCVGDTSKNGDSCQNNGICQNGTCMWVQSTQGLQQWTGGASGNVIDCTCSESNSSCHAIYVGRVTALSANTASMQFQKNGGGGPSVTASYWIVTQTNSKPKCTENDIFVVRKSGSWSAGSVLSTSASVWPSLSEFLAVPCGEGKKLHVISGGSGLTSSKIWFQYEASEFKKMCSSP